MNITPILRATNIVKKLGGKTILNDVSLDVHKGDVKVVIGPSGAGKSTFLQCLNYLLPPDSGDIWLEGKKVNARDTRELCALRQQVGMIFQDFNLFDHLTAEENVSIALRKVMGCNKAEARNRALTELSRVGLAKRAALYPAQLSGGQKQRVAIAGVIAMRPDCLVLDEATAMLDPIGREKVMRTVHRLNDDYGITVVQITHYMEEAATADRVVVMSAGRVVMEGTPKEVFRNVEELRALHLDVPQAAELCHALTAAGCPMADDIIDVEECAAALYELLTGKKAPGAAQEKAEEVSACPQS